MEPDKTCKTPRWRMLKSQLNNLTAKDFAAKAKQLNAVIIDVRTPGEYQFGHIPNATNLDYLAENFLDQVENLDKSKSYFIYCRSGRRSIRVCTWMRNGGFENDKIFNLNNGFGDWVEHFPKAVVRPKI